MSEYDFSQLNDKEFEVLGTDLLSRREGVRFERFKPGRDAGVDGRFFRSAGDEDILQCKHWASSPLERLVKHLEDVELPKVERLRPSRYYLVVSHPLSRTDKAKIVEIFSPYIGSPADVLGREDLNDLLAENPDVETRHYKLWIGSANVLRYLLNKPIQDRSAFALEEILAQAHLYVPTSNHDLAIEKLEQRGTVIITGPAGIGKTTLADHLVLHYAARDYGLVRIADEIREAEAVYDPEAKQLFYFDDFLGRNYLEALSGHEGSHIVQFIRRVVRDRRKRFVLTSRSTILNQGKVLIDVFQTNNLDRNEFEVTLESFTEMDRARVLYNHMWHSNLDPEFVDVLYEGKRYRNVVKHRNFNPRLIRYITDADQLGNRHPSTYWAYIHELLENPAKVWENPFEAQHDDFGRALVLLVTLNGRALAQSELAEAYSRFIAHPDCGSMQGHRDFVLNIRHLAGSLLTRSLEDPAAPRLNLFNPSIGDFVLHRYATDLPSLRAGFSSLRSRESLRTLVNLEANKLIAAAPAREICTHILETASNAKFVAYSPEYISVACVFLARRADVLTSHPKLVSDCLSFVIASECPGYFAEVAEFLVWASENALVDVDEALHFIKVACELHPVSTELEQLVKLANCFEVEEHDDAVDSIENAAIEYFSDSGGSEFPVEDVFDGVAPGDFPGARRNLKQLVEARFNAIGLDPSRATQTVVDAFDLSTAMAEYFAAESQDDDHDDRQPSAAATYTDEMDDLFDRSR